MIKFEIKQGNTHLTQYEGLREMVINNYIKPIPQIKKKREDHKEQTLLSEHAPL